MKDTEYLLIIDGSSLLTTQFYGNLPRGILFAKSLPEKEVHFHRILKTSKGIYTNAILGFLRVLFQILKDQKPTYLAITWDVTRDTFRRELDPTYKGNREEVLVPLKEQFELCQDILKRMGIAGFMSETYEADDYSGSLSRRFESEVPVKILTKDHDYLQLVNEKTHLWLMFPTKEKAAELYKKYEIPHTDSVPEAAFELTPELVIREFEVRPEHVNSLKGLEGDASDNIKGVPGIGHKTALKLISEYGTVSALYEAISDLTPEKEAALKSYWKKRLGLSRSPLPYLLKIDPETSKTAKDSAFLSEKLATIVCDIPLDTVSLSDLTVDLKKETVEEILRELEIRSLSVDFLDKNSEETSLGSDKNLPFTFDFSGNETGSKDGDDFITPDFKVPFE